MKRNIISIISIAAMLAAVSITAFAQTPSETSDSAIGAKVFKAINQLPYYGIFDNIGFKVEGGTVTLSGKVHSLGTSSSAAKVVKRIPGVVEVINNIEELPPSSSDNAIRRALVRRFDRAPGLYPYLIGPSPSVRLIVDRGTVTLEGYVADKGTANLMYMLARGVPGTFDVTNNLIITGSAS